MPVAKKVVVIGLDGLEPKIVERMLERGELPNLERLRSAGGYARIATTNPAQTPVAWSTFSTGTNPGGHGIFDFLRRDPLTYLPDLGLNRYEQKNAFVPPKAVNLRRGQPFWDLLSQAGVPSVILRCPCTYPPDKLRGRLLSGMGVPDLRGGMGTSTFYTEAAGVSPLESESVVQLVRQAGDATIQTYLIGPRAPKGDATLALTLVPGADGHLLLRSDGDPRELELRVGQWSPWLRVKFKPGMLQSVRGMVRFRLLRTEPHVELYASPVNFDADAPMFPVSSPWEYAAELRRETGPYYTTGMVEDHTGLSNGRFDEAAFLEQCDEVFAERERMLHYELDRLDAGFLFCLFDTPDRIQHMFWRFSEADHPANAAHGSDDYGGVIEECYRRCDAIVGRVLERLSPDTLVIAMSDHGFNSFQRGVHVNAWLREQGLLTLLPGVDAGAEAGDFFRHVDWSRTSAYALGLGGIYINRRGREGQGIVDDAEAVRLQTAISSALAGLRDPARGAVAVRSVVAREDAYHGPFVTEAPDLLVNFGAGYRASWSTALGGVPAESFEDNVKKWGGDHIVDPALVPGVLFMNRAFTADDAALTDMAPTILAALGVAAGPAMHGRSLIT